MSASSIVPTAVPETSPIEHPDGATGLVSVVVTTRNSAETLEACLTSIHEQTYTSIELIVVDNGSTDSTPSIARRYADTFFEAGPERSAQRNRAVERATGEFVLIVDSDMVLTPEVVGACVAAARAEGVAAIVIPERSVGEGFWAACKALERSCYVGDETIEAARFYAREAYRRYGGYEEEFTGPEDWDLPARMRGRERMGRVDAEIVHLEGRLRLLDSMRKKYYYGKSLERYVRRHRALAGWQMIPVRPAFLRHRRRLARQPVLATAMLLMKAAEFSAAGAGLLTELIRRPRR